MTDTALLADRGGFEVGFHAAAIQVGAGRWTGGKAAGEVAVSWALQRYFSTVIVVVAVRSGGTLEILALNGPFHAGTALDTACGEPCLASRNDSALGVSAATLNFKNTLVFIQHVARLTDAALLASRGAFRAGAPTEGTGVQAGRETEGKAVGVVAVGGALQSYFGAVTVAIFIVLAVSPWGTLGTLALNSPSHAGTALGTAWGGPGLACLWKSWDKVDHQDRGTG